MPIRSILLVSALVAAGCQTAGQPQQESPDPSVDLRHSQLDCQGEKLAFGAEEVTLDGMHAYFSQQGHDLELTNPNQDIEQHYEVQRVDDSHVTLFDPKDKQTLKCTETSL